MERGLAASTVESYRRDLRRYSALLAGRGKTRLGDVTPADVAEFLAPYVEAGCTEFNLIPQSPDPDRVAADVATVKKLLAGVA